MEKRKCVVCGDRFERNGYVSCPAHSFGETEEVHKEGCPVREGERQCTCDD